MMLRPRARIARDRRGGYAVRLPEAERTLIASLPARLLGTLEDLADSAVPVPTTLARLFPAAYPTDAAAEASYVALARADLVARRRDALTALERTARATHLDDGELESWLNALNDLRLALGTALGVTEELVERDENDPAYVDWVCYQYLSYLQNEVVDALSGALPEPIAGSGEDLPEDPWGPPPGGLRWDGTERPTQS